ncbi:hypothetical protein [Eisenibacter elegans]|jgi:hypothetical protein|uniref:hypothetical protein n=1 Tax=Eisenibacter elegans TaxID=997 RepID=UPI00047B99F2|nr:hypothetical protein [Eisenibacter elegans]
MHRHSLWFVLTLVFFTAPLNMSAQAESQENYRRWQEDAFVTHTRLAAAPDSAEALVRFFFSQRRSARRSLVIAAGSAAVFGSVFLLPAGNLAVEAIGLAGLAVSAPGLVLSPLTFRRYSKKKLFFLLQDYREGRGIPEKYYPAVERYLEKMAEDTPTK